jgi:hypothetical protein
MASLLSGVSILVDIMMFAWRSEVRIREEEAG